MVDYSAAFLLFPLFICPTQYISLLSYVAFAHRCECVANHFDFICGTARPFLYAPSKTVLFFHFLCLFFQLQCLQSTCYYTKFGWLESLKQRKLKGKV